MALLFYFLSHFIYADIRIYPKINMVKKYDKHRSSSRARSLVFAACLGVMRGMKTGKRYWTSA
jgi:hypothetical protein